MSMNEKNTEEFVVNQIIKFMINKENDNWNEEKVSILLRSYALYGCGSIFNYVMNKIKVSKK